MTGITDHTVSLTKQNYIRLIDLIRQYPKDEILNHLDEISADRSQAIKMLAGNVDTEALPEAWDTIKDFPPESQLALFIVSIIFSHRDLINSFRQSTNAEMRGVIQRGVIGDKPYTNLANTLNEAGMAERFGRGQNESRYNLTPVFRDMGIGPLAKEILEGQLRRMGWTPPTDGDHWKRTFYEQCFHYGFQEALGVDEQQFEDWLEGNSVQVYELPVIQPLETEITTSGRLVAALATKRFAILAGSTGTGKTQTILRLANDLNPISEIDNEFNCAFVPVGAGWTDSRHLLGYRNPFGADGATYAITPVIKLLLKANFNQYRDVPFFLILDEMNLSYVELYFAKFLSLMESSIDGQPHSVIDLDDLDLLYKTAGTTSESVLIDAALASGGLFLTPNVFVVGTVNVDETTHNFSPKVLDRSFVLEYAPGIPSSVDNEFSIPDADSLIATSANVSTFLTQDTFPDVDIEVINAHLDDLFNRLGRFRFGPRVVHEARKHWSAVKSEFAAQAISLPVTLASDQAILDNLLFQKLLPKIHGNKAQLHNVLPGLVEFAKAHSLDQSLQKLEAMQQDVTMIGFANFFSMQ